MTPSERTACGLPHHTRKRRLYLSQWATVHRAKLRAMPLAKLKAMKPTVYSRPILATRTRKLMQAAAPLSRLGSPTRPTRVPQDLRRS